MAIDVLTSLHHLLIPRLSRMGKGEFVMDITLGAERMLVQMDTGSSKVFVWAQWCTSDECRDNPKYQGITGRDTQNPGHASFVDGQKVSGTIWKDSFAINGATVTIENQDICKLKLTFVTTFFKSRIPR
jgi:hypothetical protein